MVVIIRYLKYMVLNFGRNIMPNDSNVNIGNSGEYFVAGELERRGFTVAVPMSNVKDFDLLAIILQIFQRWYWF